MTAPARIGRDRDDHVAAYSSALGAIAELDTLEATHAFPARRIAAHRHLRLDELERAAEAYEASLPELALSRCPHTGDVLALPIDVAGFDGPWWNHAVPRRPLASRLPETMAGFDGGVAIAGPPPPTPFAVKLGPEVPTVVPRMLDDPGVLAVLSSFAIGTNTAYLTVYYAAPGTEDPPVMDDWGTDHYLAVAADGHPIRVPVGPAERDADLAPWLDSGRLRWIAPGDGDLELRGGAAGCPYVGLAGHAEVAWLAGGEITRETPPPATPDQGA